MGDQKVKLKNITGKSKELFNSGIEKTKESVDKAMSAFKKQDIGLDIDTIQSALDYGYERAIDGIPGFESASDLADNYLQKEEDLVSAANTLINWQIAKAGTSGFLTGIGGIIIMPVTIPANIASVLYVQLRMIAAIAHLGGYDLKDDRVKSLVYICMAGNGAKDIVKDIGIVIGTKMTTQMIKGISSKTITAINQKVGFRLLTKFGQKGAVNLGKAVPIVGGVIGGTFDVVSTKAIGEIAKKVFLSSDHDINVKDDSLSENLPL